MTPTSRTSIPGVNGHWHRLGDTELHLVDAPCAGSGIDPTGPHFCVYVDDLDAAITELDDRKIDYAHGAQGDLSRSGSPTPPATPPSSNRIPLFESTRPYVHPYHYTHSGTLSALEPRTLAVDQLPLVARGKRSHSAVESFEAGAAGTFASGMPPTCAP